MSSHKGERHEIADNPRVICSPYLSISSFWSRLVLIMVGLPSSILLFIRL